MKAGTNFSGEKKTCLGFEAELPDDNWLCRLRVKVLTALESKWIKTKAPGKILQIDSESLRYNHESEFIIISLNNKFLIKLCFSISDCINEKFAYTEI